MLQDILCFYSKCLKFLHPVQFMLQPARSWYNSYEQLLRNPPLITWKLGKEVCIDNIFVRGSHDPASLLWLDNPITGRWRLVSVNVYSFSWRKPCACMLHWKSQTNYKTVNCANWQSLHLILILTSCPAVLGRVVIEKKFLDFVAIF